MERRLKILLTLPELPKPLDFNGILRAISLCINHFANASILSVGVRSRFGFWRLYFVTGPDGQAT